MSRSFEARSRWHSPGVAVKAATLFVVFVCAALLAVNGWLALRGRAEAVRQGTVGAINLTQAIAQQVDSMLAETGRILDTVAFELERADNDAGALERLQPVLVNYAAGTAQIHSLFVMDLRGQRTLSSETTANARANDAQRDYFMDHRGNLSLMRRVGKPYRSRLDGAWLIPVSRRLNDRDGNFAGVVLATIEVDYVGQLMAGYDVGRYGVLALNLTDGPLLARRPYSADYMEKSTVGSPQLALLQKNLSGTAELVSPLDGVQRIVSYQHLKNHRLFVTVALSEMDILENWRTTTYVQSGWIVLLCGLTGWLGAMVIRAVGARLRVEHRLRSARDALTVVNTQLTHLARYDGLTGLANRRSFDEHLAREFVLSLQTRRPLALIMIDVDHFKMYNDTCGHPEGDKCLAAVARAIGSATRRPEAFVARYGGEEMAVLLAGTDAAGAALVAEAIRLTVAELKLPFAASPTGHVSISAGVAAHVDSGLKASAVELLDAADKALYQAKRNGRNTVVTNR